MDADRPDYCEWCGNRLATDPHHQVKRSRGGHDNGIIWLCRQCHDRTEDEEDFYQLVQEYYQSMQSNQ